MSPLIIKENISSGELSTNQWDNSGYKKLFGLRDNDKSIDIAIKDMLEILKHGLNGYYIKLIENVEIKDMPLLTPEEKPLKWKDCCDEAIEFF
eukprot:1690590-Ditylum_brightwellii.AAC.1